MWVLFWASVFVLLCFSPTTEVFQEEFFSFFTFRDYTVVILEEAYMMRKAERKQTNKYPLLIKVSRAHFIGQEQFPKHHALVFFEFLTHLQTFDFRKTLTEKFS